MVRNRKGRAYVLAALILAILPLPFIAVEKKEIDKSKVQVVFFTATWCEPCQRMKKFVIHHKDVKAELSKYQKSKVKKDYEPYYVDVDKHPDYTEKYEVDVMPTIILINSEDGKVLKRQRGYTGVKEFIEFLKK